ncbi:MAG TPA: glycosyltransferase family 2 protein [Acidimicrobiia bacterium]|nr:glycosyltransferase family 2 protein [Acidimicrobiia bacterium]
MLRGLLRGAEALLLSLVVWNLATALAGWRNQRPAPLGSRARRFRVVIPAHDEERVVGGVLGDLASQDHPHHSIWVLADRCTDGTAEVAKGAGANVAERRTGDDGKGAALSWYLERHPLDPDEALVVLDADNRVPANLLTRFSDELDAGHAVLQAYLDVSNPDASPVAMASALSYWASNRMVQLARTNLGWTADLGGTGMCLTAGAIEAAGGFGTSLVEDQEMGVRLFVAGIPVRWLHDVRVRDEKPSDAGVAIRQRSRWATGRSEVARRWSGSLLRLRSLAALDLALRLRQPSRMGVAVVSAGLAAGGLLGLPVSAGLWGTVAAVQVLAPLPFLARDGVPARYLVRYPVLALLPILKIPARLVRQRGWYHTPHGTERDTT